MTGDRQRKGAIEYQEYLAKLIEAAKKLGAKESDAKYPEWADNGAKRALVDFFYPQDYLAYEVDTAVCHTKPDSWVGNPIKERKVERAIKAVLPADFDRLDDLITLVKARFEYH